MIKNEKLEKLYKSLFDKFGSAVAVNRELERQGIVEEYRKTLRKLHKLGCKIGERSKGVPDYADDLYKRAVALGYTNLRDGLIGEYQKAGSSAIAGKKFGISGQSMLHWLHHYNVPVKSRGGLNNPKGTNGMTMAKKARQLGYGDSDNALLCLWNESGNVEKIAEKFGMTSDIIERKLIGLGVK